MNSPEARRAPCGESRGTYIPGMPVHHAIITDVCRTNRTDLGAFDEAARRLRSEYEQSCRGWRASAVTFHLVLAVDPAPVATPGAVRVDPRCAAESNIGRCTLGHAHAGEHQYYGVAPMATPPKGA